LFYLNIDLSLGMGLPHAILLPRRSQQSLARYCVRLKFAAWCSPPDGVRKLAGPRLDSITGFRNEIDWPTIHSAGSKATEMSSMS